MKTLLSNTFTKLIVETTENPLFETLWSTVLNHSEKETWKSNYQSRKYGFFPKWNHNKSDLPFCDEGNKLVVMD